VPVARGRLPSTKEIVAPYSVASFGFPQGLVHLPETQNQEYPVLPQEEGIDVTSPRFHGSVRQIEAVGESSEAGVTLPFHGWYHTSFAQVEDIHNFDQASIT